MQIKLRQSAEGCLNKLRQSAEGRLKNGNAPPTQGWPTGVQALTLLHGLASAPATASDALKLLHELQVHQVELDLQHEQAEQDRRQLTEDMANCSALFELAPFAYLVLEPQGVVTAANCIAADWLAPAPGQTPGHGPAQAQAQQQPPGLAGRHIEDLLAPQSGAAVRALLAALRKGWGRQSCAVHPRSGGASAQAVATATPGGRQVLMAFMPAGPGPAAAERSRPGQAGA